MHLLDGFDGYVPLVRQAEAYDEHGLLMLVNDHTQRVVALTENLCKKPIAKVKYFADFLANLQSRVAHRTVIITFGDSNSTNYSSWPSQLNLKLHESIVINLSDWATYTADFYFCVAYTVTWARRLHASKILVLTLAGLTDSARLQDYIVRYRAGQVASPITGSEQWLAERSSASLAALIAKPAIGNADGWIARRLIALYTSLQITCKAQDALFVFVLQPLCYEDCTPQYFQELRIKFGEEQKEKSFDVWLERTGFQSSPEGRFDGLAVRGILERLRASMPSGMLDLADLFKRASINGFNAQYDAMHLSQEGHQIVAAEIIHYLETLSGAELR